ncbi:hypothetical protein C8F01DRAFT_1320917 [Mycena amicta]|nr:hypothetical protein C8F01DRAFT_1320917 [Mycena amicta]
MWGKARETPADIGYFDGSDEDVRRWLILCLLLATGRGPRGAGRAAYISHMPILTRRGSCLLSTGARLVLGSISSTGPRAPSVLIDRPDAAGLVIEIVGGETPIGEGLDKMIAKGETDFLG